MHGHCIADSIMYRGILQCLLRSEPSSCSNSSLVMAMWLRLDDITTGNVRCIGSLALILPIPFRNAILCVTTLFSFFLVYFGFDISGGERKGESKGILHHVSKMPIIKLGAFHSNLNRRNFSETTPLTPPSTTSAGNTYIMSEEQEPIEPLTPDEANRIIHSHRKVRYGKLLSR